VAIASWNGYLTAIAEHILLFEVDRFWSKTAESKFLSTNEIFPLRQPLNLIFYKIETLIKNDEVCSDRLRAVWKSTHRRWSQYYQNIDKLANHLIAKLYRGKAL
jgi:hypothetical protein